MEIRHLGKGIIEVRSNDSALAQQNPDVYDLSSESDRAFFLLNTNFHEFFTRDAMHEATREEAEDRARFEMALGKANILRAKLTSYKRDLKGAPVDLEFMFEVAEIIEKLETMTTSEAYSLDARDPNAYTQALLELEQGSTIKMTVASDLKPVFTRPPTLESTRQEVASRFEYMKFVLHINVRKMSQSMKSLAIKVIAETDPNHLIPDYAAQLRAELAAEATAAKRD